jgi:chemotaxis protein MotA
MDIMTIFGIIAGLVLCGYGIILSAGVSGLVAFINIPSLLITFGGSFASLMVNYPLKRVINFAKVLNKALKETHEDPSEIINTFVNLSKKARTDGLLALEEDVKNIKNDFLKRGVQLVIDGVDADFIRNLMETELTFIRERHKVGQEMFFALGTYNPAWGIIGTVIGLILMLRRLEDPSMIGIGMAVALLTTLYGLIGGYLIWNPIGGKLRRKSEEEIFVKEVIIRGVMLLQAGAAPRLIESNLKAYLEPKMRQVGVPKK